MDVDIRTSHPMLHQLMQRWIIAAACIVLDCQNEPDTADCPKELFSGLSTKYNTRGKVNKRLEILQHKRKSGVNSISNRFSLLLNSLRKDVKLCPSRSSFKQFVCISSRSCKSILSYWSSVWQRFNSLIRSIYILIYHFIRVCVCVCVCKSQVCRHLCTDCHQTSHTH